jgi:hypothetical protein
MTQTSLSHPLRGELVRAAETVLDKQGGLPRNPENSQLSRLVQIATEAACADEIANYLRYQGARGRWKRSLAEDVIEALHPLLAGLGSEAERVAAWRLYATFLRRSYYYRREVNRDLERSRRKDGPPQHRSAAPPRGEARSEEAGAEAGGKRRRPRRRRKGHGAPGEPGVAEASGAETAEHEGSGGEAHGAGAPYAGHEDGAELRADVSPHGGGEPEHSAHDDSGHDAGHDHSGQNGHDEPNGEHQS